VLNLVAAMLFSLPAQAAPVVSFSYRALVGASVRVEVPVSPLLSPFGEVGASGWVIPGDDPTTGQGSVLLLRLHGKVGIDVGHAAGGVYIGPRVVVADTRVWGGVDNRELGLLATVGYKAVGQAGRGTRTQLGVGGGLHAFRSSGPDPQVAVFPLPHVELRFGF
jgi:hypothetical protein